MKNLKAKLRKNGGFTLIEMLIVVAIIAILIAISIPIVGNALERAKKATDAANERAAKGEIIIMYLNSTADPGVTFDASKVYAYDAANGKMIETAPTVKYGQCDDHSGDFLLVKYNTSDHTVSMGWTDTYSATTVPTGTLCSSEVGATT